MTAYLPRVRCITLTLLYINDLISASILTKVVQEAAPKVALECGTFCGYSAVVIASNMPEEGQLMTIEANPKSAEIARKIINRAGFGDKVCCKLFSMQSMCDGCFP